MRFGEPLTKAYANLLLVGHVGKAERMASMPTPVGDLKYAVRGNVPKRHLVAVQHFRHPEVRILGYRELAKDTGGVVWATPDGTAYSPPGAAPPDAWFELVLPRIPIALERHGDDLRCPHFDGVADVTDPRAPAGIALTLAPGPTRFLICTQCATTMPKGQSLLAIIGRYLIGLRAERDVAVRPTGTPTHCVHDGDCAWVRHPPRVKDRILDAYRAGTRPEADLLTDFRPAWEAAVREAGETLLVAGDECHGADREGFLDALQVDAGMREGVAAFLEAGPDVVIAPDKSAAKVLDACWDAAPRVLARLHPDPDDLDRLLAKHRKSPPTRILEEVLEARGAAVALAGFPRYDDLPAPAAVADRLARAHRIAGASGLTDAVDRELKRATHKGLLWAALRRTGATSGREWQFDRNDQEAGEFLEGPLGTLLDAPADRYHAALGEVHTLAGGVGDPPRPSGTR